MTETKKARELVVGDRIRFDGDPVTVDAAHHIQSGNFMSVELVLRTDGGRVEVVEFGPDDLVARAE